MDISERLGGGGNIFFFGGGEVGGRGLEGEWMGGGGRAWYNKDKGPSRANKEHVKTAACPLTVQ